MASFLAQSQSPGRVGCQQAATLGPWSGETPTLPAPSPWHLTLAGTFRAARVGAILVSPCPGLDLNSLCHPHPHATHRFYLACVVLGLQFLHEKKIIYR